MHINGFGAYLICAELKQIAVQCTVLLNPRADSGDCMAASDYKHPGWCCPFPSVFYTVVWGRIGKGRGVVRPWRVTVTMTPVSCLFISRAPRCPLSSAPWLPDDNSGASTTQPGWVFTDNHVTGTVETMSTRPRRRTAVQSLGQAGRAHCSSGVWVLPVWPSATTMHCWPKLFLVNSL